jgi:hypothetical protein
MVWPFDPNQTIALVVGVPGTLAAIFAAIYAFRADTFGRRSARQQDLLRDFDIQPRLEVPFTPIAPDSPLTVVVRNLGGPAIRFVWVGSDDTRVGMCTGSVGHSSVVNPFRGWLLGESTFRTAIATLLLVAEDVQGRWWDCRTGVKLTGPVDGYLKKRMEGVGMGHLAEQVVLQVPPRMPPEATHSYEERDNPERR